MENNLDEVLEIILHREQNKEQFIRDMQARPLVIYGGAAGGRKTLRCCKKNGLVVAGFCDSNPVCWGECLEEQGESYRISSLQEILDKYGRENVNILIGANEKFEQEIRKTLLSGGIPAEHIFAKKLLNADVIRYPYDSVE